MRSVHELWRPRRRAPLAALAVLTLATAGCSSNSNRFNNPFSNPFSSSPAPETTGSVPAPSGRVETRPLPQTQAQYQSGPLPPPSRPATVRPASYGTSGGGSGIATYQPAPARADVTGSVSAPAPAPAPGHQGKHGAGQLELGRRHRRHRRCQRDRQHHRAPLRRAGLRHHAGQRHRRSAHDPSGSAAGHPAL